MKISKEQKILQSIITKAWEDENFKQELIENPVIAIEHLTRERVNLPEGKTVVIHDQTSESVIYITIPQKCKMDDAELSEEQLEIVAGGGILTEPGVRNLFYEQ